jgi:flagellar hook-associated protein 1 FlgK
MPADLFGIGVSGLLATRRALSTVGHNIANVNTPGYSRQRTDLDTRTPQPEGKSFVGAGVEVTNIGRLFDGFISGQLRAATTNVSQTRVLHQLASQVDNLLADPKSGLAGPLQDFFAAVQRVAEDPSSSAVRQVLLGAGRGLAGRFQALDARLSELDAGVNEHLASTLAEVNALASALAEVNRDIVRAGGQTAGGSPNDLLDQRDELVRQIAERVSVRVTEQSDGSVTVAVGNGQSLVVGTRASELRMVDDVFDPTRQQVGYVLGGNVVPISQFLSGGTIGGLLDFRSEVLDAARNGLGQVAIGLAETFNAQHGLGMDLDGGLGADFFADLASASPAVLVSVQNTGSAQVDADITDVSALTTSDYRLDRTGATYTVTRLSDGNVTTLAAFPLAPETIDGLTLTLTAGAVADGDSFLIRPTRAGARDFDMLVNDTRAIAAAAPIRTAASLANIGSARISEGRVDPPPPPNPNVLQPVTLTFTSPTTFDVSGTGTGNPTGLTYVAGAPISFNGWSVEISGAPAAGDSFDIRSNAGGVGDNRNALALAGLQSTPVLNGGTANYAEGYGVIVTDVGTRTRQTEIEQSAQEALLDQATAARESVSGVNLDEEAADLLRFQQAYQASARVVSIADQVFQTLLRAVGG